MLSKKDKEDIQKLCEKLDTGIIPPYVGAKTPARRVASIIFIMLLFIVMVVLPFAYFLVMYWVV